MKLNIIKSELEENKICQDIYNKKQETFKPKINKNCEKNDMFSECDSLDNKDQIEYKLEESKRDDGCCSIF